jgi:uncharacterized phage protein (predicted DNA packaging)
MADLPTLEETKEFARIDSADDDATMTTLLTAAIEFVETSTGRDYSSSGADVPDRARLAIMALVSAWYDAEAMDRSPKHIRSLVHQLRDWKDPAVAEGEAEAAA